MVGNCENSCNIEEWRKWKQYPVEGTRFSFFWKPGESGLKPLLPPIHFHAQVSDPLFCMVTIGFQDHDENGLDLLAGKLNGTGLMTYLCGSLGYQFLDGGGDYALVEEGKPHPIFILSEIIARIDTKNEQRKKLGELRKIEADMPDQPFTW
jgi:hypothetical protein